DRPIEPRGDDPWTAKRTEIRHRPALPGRQHWVEQRHAAGRYQPWCEAWWRGLLDAWEVQPRGPWNAAGGGLGLSGIGRAQNEAGALPPTHHGGPHLALGDDGGRQVQRPRIERTHAIQRHRPAR